MRTRWYNLIKTLGTVLEFVYLVIVRHHVDAVDARKRNGVVSVVGVDVDAVVIVDVVAVVVVIDNCS